jgi:hypothetical protein
VSCFKLFRARKSIEGLVRSLQSRFEFQSRMNPSSIVYACFIMVGKSGLPQQRQSSYRSLDPLPICTSISPQLRTCATISTDPPFPVIISSGFPIFHLVFRYINLRNPHRGMSGLRIRQWDDIGCGGVKLREIPINSELVTIQRMLQLQSRNESCHSNVKCPRALLCYVIRIK